MKKKLNLTLFGYGLTTKAIAKHHGPANFYDDNVIKPFKDENNNKLNPSHDFNPKYSSIEIPSPGMPPKHALIQRAENLVSEYDLFLGSSSPLKAEKLPFNIWISGTNGKTTTTQMLQHLLAEKGSQAGGNIGTPLADLDIDAPIWILETSSFTLHYTNEASPNIYLLLPIAPDHLSWHGSYEEYYKAKLKPFATMREGEVAIVPKEFADIETDAFLITYENDQDLAAYFGIERDKVKFKGAFLLDAIIAMGVDKILYDTIDYDKINAFTLDPHRQEELYDYRERLWVNDTKATNIDATLAALKRYEEQHIHLILGGDDKGVDLHPLFEALTGYDVEIYTLGTNEDRLNTLAAEYNIKCTSSSSIEKAVADIARYHDNNSVALLSPAASSLDQFPSYAVRGERFKEAVGNLDKN
ncbi:MAG: UDP-N-acetylmuramoyl-L-alanine--D-glutamate ligase [Helicobacteraceae bacterium]|jgi:UDP-N-acetylmuramoylalanine--D-glutamate ligase|nr:UDP-N-acetylmuramoyl-L-alanine--D-glutamate ligase [Helicobacteraceae bacterium]